MDVMDDKTCVCGCKRKFKVNKGNAQIYYSFFECDPAGRRYIEEFRFGASSRLGGVVPRLEHDFLEDQDALLNY